MNRLKKLYEILLLCLLGILLSKVVLYIEDVNFYEYNNEFASLLSDLVIKIAKKNIYFLLSFIILLFFYIKIYKQEVLNFNISIKKVINFLVYMNVLTIFFPPLRLKYIFLALLILSSLYFPFRKKTRMPFAFNFLLLWFIISTILGFLQGFSGINKVREVIPLNFQITHILHLANALLVYYVIVKNNWDFKEFERFFKLILMFGLIIGIECIITFYLDIKKDLSIFYSSINFLGFFNSTFIGSYHRVGRIGITMIFMSIYFISKYKKKIYILYFILGYLLVFATLSRMIVMATTIFLFIFLFFAIKYSWFSHKISIPIKGISYIVIAIFVIFLFNFLLEKGKEKRGEHFTSYVGFISRALIYSRAIDVFIQNPIIGTGTGLVPFYLVSSRIPKHFSDWFEYKFNLINFGLPYLDRGGTFYDIPTYEDVITIHNLYLQFVLELGIGGIVFLIIIFYKGKKMFFDILSCSKEYNSKYSRIMYFSVFFLVITILFTMLTTVKFSIYWYYAILFGFVNMLYCYIKKEFLINNTRTCF